MANNTLLMNIDIGETRVGLIADGALRELYVERRHHRSPVGNIYPVSYTHLTLPTKRIV